MKEDIIAIVCPDIHGRNFWEKAAEEYDGSVPFIFLGDYLDPYSDEGINDEIAKKNFEKIWEFKEKWGDKVILLLGNHDLSYYDYYFRCCRYSFISGTWFPEFIRKNWEHFNIAYNLYNSDKKYILSHAGIHPTWLKENQLENIYDADYINSLFTQDKRLFNDYTYYRGGYSNAGSPVWADIREFGKLELIEENLKQIVGHSLLVKDKLDLNNVCCIDSRQVFVITKNNEIIPYKNEKR